jgi:protein-S-isoprenylcysteine O-methyltransferase Ste14
MPSAPSLHMVGVVLMALFAVQGAVMLLSPGSIRLQRPDGGLLPWAYNLCNLFILLVVTPIVAVLHLREAGDTLEAIRVPLPELARIFAVWTGLAVYTMGNLLLILSRLGLSSSFRLGAVPPGEGDKLQTGGLYRWMRHPMYTAVHALTAGLTLVTCSPVILALWMIVGALIGRLIPIEEGQLVQAYGGQYEAFRQRVPALMPVWAAVAVVVLFVLMALAVVVIDVADPFCWRAYVAYDGQCAWE